MTPEAEKVWKASEDYIDLAIHHLRPKRPMPDQRADRERLRIAYLFPTLKDGRRDNLLKVRECFLATQESRAKEKAEPDKYSAENLEAITNDSEKELAANLYGFPILLQEIIRTHFLLYPDRH